jgi:hypothetical protein
LNLYVLVEGRETEKTVYAAWIRQAFPSLTRVHRVEDIRADNFFIIAGHGYPSYLNRIPDAVRDVHDNPAIDYLWVCVDAEEQTAAAREAEIYRLISGVGLPCNHKIVVQDCCIETWFLGNERIVPTNPQGERLRRFKAFYDVKTLDPELMPATAGFTTRAKFHYAYLCDVFKEHHHLAYNKSSAHHVAEGHYLKALITRAFSRGHISSFRSTVEMWRELGSDLLARIDDV